jgi:hypothetical protein
VGKEQVEIADRRSAIGDRREDLSEFCHAIEVYLCQKNDGHLIRVVGPSFERVSQWAARGVPLKIAYAGIDRYFERYYRNGPRRRPVKIDFCEADVLDVFDEWQRAVGVVADADARGDSRPPIPDSRRSLPAHLERVLVRLTRARASGTLDDSFDRLIDGVSGALDAARTAPGGLRGAARRALLDRLTAIDAELLRQARALVDDRSRADLARQADAELAPFQSAMRADAFARAHEAAIDRLVRERFNLPIVGYA